MGMTPEQAIGIFAKQTALRGAFPIAELVPDEDTKEVINKARSGTDLVGYGSVDEMMVEFDDGRANSHDEV